MDITTAVYKAIEGDNDAYTFLYNETYQKNYYIALKYLHDEQKAQDVLQMAYIKVFKMLGQLRNPEKFASYIAQTVAHYSINELKKNNPILFSETETEDEGDISDTFEEERVDVQPELALDQKETSRIVNEIISELSDEQRICITMFYMEEIPVKNIAQILGVSENTVKSRLNYGRQKIKAIVEDLEKKGTKLLGLSPLVFFLILFKTEAKACEASIAIPAAGGQLAKYVVVSGVNKKAAIATSKVVAEKTATATGKASGKGLAGAVASHKGAVIATATVIGVGGIGGAVYSNLPVDIPEWVYTVPSANEQFESYFLIQVDQSEYPLVLKKETVNYDMEDGTFLTQNENSLKIIGSNNDREYINSNADMYAKIYNNMLFVAGFDDYAWGYTLDMHMVDLNNTKGSDGWICLQCEMIDGIGESNFQVQEQSLYQINSYDYNTEPNSPLLTYVIEDIDKDCFSTWVNVSSYDFYDDVEDAYIAYVKDKDKLWDEIEKSRVTVNNVENQISIPEPDTSSEIIDEEIIFNGSQVDEESDVDNRVDEAENISTEDITTEAEEAILLTKPEIGEFEQVDTTGMIGDGLLYEIFWEPVPGADGYECNYTEAIIGEEDDIYEYTEDQKETRGSVGASDTIVATLRVRAYKYLSDGTKEYGEWSSKRTVIFPD